MNYYELMVILSPEITEDEEKEQTNQIQDLLQKEGGTLHYIDHWGKRKLAYTIKKQRQGYYEWFYVELDPGRIAEIDRKLKMSETILRFMMLRMEKAQIELFHQDLERKKASAEARTEESSGEETSEVTAEAEAVREEPAVQKEAVKEEEPGAKEEPVAKEEAVAEEKPVVVEEREQEKPDTKPAAKKEEPVVKDEAMKAAEKAVESLKAEMKTVKTETRSTTEASGESADEAPGKE